MPSEEELRTGLRRLSDRGPRPTEADLWTARDHGRRRLRVQRLRRGALVALAFVAAVGVGFALAGGDDGTEVGPADSPDTTGVTPSTTTPSTTASSVPIDASDPTSPTQAAVTADQVERVVPTGYEDCGSVRVTAGWPTTFAFFGSTDCILAAAAAGTPAQYSTSARDFIGGMTGTIFRVESLERITVIRYEVNQFGSVEVIDTETCTALVEKFPTPECV
jgi:hypothetical protein